MKREASRSVGGMRSIASRLVFTMRERERQDEKSDEERREEIKRCNEIPCQFISEGTKKSLL